MVSNLYGTIKLSLYGMSRSVFFSTDVGLFIYQNVTSKYNFMPSKLKVVRVQEVQVGLEKRLGIKA